MNALQHANLLIVWCAQGCFFGVLKRGIFIDFLRCAVCVSMYIHTYVYTCISMSIARFPEQLMTHSFLPQNIKMAHIIPQLRLLCSLVYIHTYRDFSLAPRLRGFSRTLVPSTPTAVLPYYSSMYRM